MARPTRGTRIARLAGAPAIASAIAGCGSGGNQNTDGGVPIHLPAATNVDLSAVTVTVRTWLSGCCPVAHSSPARCN